MVGETLRKGRRHGVGLPQPPIQDEGKGEGRGGLLQGRRRGAGLPEAWLRKPWILGGASKDLIHGQVEVIIQQATDTDCGLQGHRLGRRCPSRRR